MELSNGDACLKWLYSLYFLKSSVFRTNVKDERTLYEETREAKELLQSLGGKIDMLKALSSKLASRREQQNARENCERHKKELIENQKQLRSAAIRARKAINESARSSLLEGGTSEAKSKKFNMDEKNLKDNAVKTTERLSDLLSKMGDRVAQSEQTMDSLIHSSSVLVQTHTEFESHAGHIKVISFV
ncbi:hypothetical protein COOONC_08976 [Cooperia oncophora]